MSLSAGGIGKYYLTGTVSAKSWLGDLWDDIVGTAEDTSESVAVPSATTGCGGESMIDEHLEDGQNMYPPSADGYGDADVTETESGALIINAGWEPSVILPTEGETTVLPGDVFDVAYSGGRGVFFQETPDILLKSGDITGSGLQNMDLYIEIGTDSTRIPAMPQDNPDTPDVNENAEACFDGLITTTQLSEEDLAAGMIGCPETGYESFVFCPADTGNRLTVYLAGYTLVGKRFEGGEYETIDEMEFAPEADLYVNPELGVLIGEVCGESPAPYNDLSIPRNFYSDGYLNVQLRLRLVVDARGAVDGHNYETRMSVKIKAREE
jgi:hypothetical protein